MTRKRRSNRGADPNRPNQYVMAFAFGRVEHDRRTWWYRSLTMREAQAMVERGELREIELETDHGTIAAFQETTAPSYAAGEHRKLYRSPTTLTLATMNAIAVAEPGVWLSRGEHAQLMKFKVWPLIGDTKAVAVRPRMSDSERIAAQKLLTPRQTTSRMDERKRHDVRTLHLATPEMAAAA